MTTTLAPNLMVDDVARALEFYEGVLGCERVFAVKASEVPGSGMQGEQLVYAQVKKDAAEVMLQQRESMVEDLPFFAGREKGASCTLYLMTDAFGEILTRVEEAGVRVLLPVRETWYGMREVYVEDPDGYAVCIAERVGEG